MPTVEVNLIAIIFAGILNMLIGMGWYRIWAKPWLTLLNKTPETLDQNQPRMGPTYAITMLTSLILAYVLAHFIQYASITSWLAGLQLGFWVWLGFVATTFLPNYLFADKPIKLWFIDCGYYVVSIPLQAALLTLWH